MVLVSTGFALLIMKPICPVTVFCVPDWLNQGMLLFRRFCSNIGQEQSQARACAKCLASILGTQPV